MTGQRVESAGEQTRDDHISISANTNTRPTISHLHMRNSILCTAQADDARLLIQVLLFRLSRKHLHLKFKMVGPEQQLNLPSVFGEPLRHYGKFQAADDNKMSLNFEVTDATRPTLSTKGPDPGAMTIFRPCSGAPTSSKSSTRKAPKFFTQNRQSSQEPYVQPSAASDEPICEGAREEARAGV